MKSRIIDPGKPVSELVAQYPEIKAIMADLGFKDIVKPMALSTVGRIMTLQRGAALKGIDMAAIVAAFREQGFEVARGDVGAALDQMQPAQPEPVPAKVQTAAQTPVRNQAPGDGGTPEARARLLKSYVARLSAGDDLEQVRAEFVENFESVEAEEIARAEQALIQGGAKIADVQRLCDVHSALFHGATREEQIANAETAVVDSLNRKKAREEGALQAVAGIPGHPVSVFVAENERIAAMVEAVRQALAGDALDSRKMAAQAEALRPVALHYARKGDLLYPLLSRTYGFSGPSDVMWGVDDEIRDELKLLATAGEGLPDFGGRLSRVVTRAGEMVYKENNILYPLCLQQFSQADWMRIYYELPAYDTLLTAGYPVWEAAEAQRDVLWKTGGQPTGPSEEHRREGTLDKTVQSPDNTAHSLDKTVQSLAKTVQPLDKTVQSPDKTAQPLAKTVQSSAKTAQPLAKTVQSPAKTVQRPIPIGSGSLTPEQMEGVLNTIPMELSFVDEDDINRFFNDGDKLFKRPDMAIGRDVYACHPPRYEAMVRQIIGDFRAGTRDHVDVWMDKGGEPVLVRYMAVKNNGGKYIGTLECVQKMKFAEEHFINPL